jgi:MFS transporter, MHS family, proline/betaine transporter
VVIRLIQGLTVGGEFSSSVTYMVETAPSGRRGCAGSWANFGSMSGTLLGSGTSAAFATMLSTAPLHSWGWRVPFLLGILLAAFALYMRRNLPHTQLFKEHVKNHTDDNPLHEALTRGQSGALLAAQLLFAVLVAFSVAIAPVMFVEMFPTEDRLTGYSLAFDIGLGLVGGTAPVIAIWLIEATGMPAAPGLYLAGLSLVSVVALAFMRDRSRALLL